MTTNHDQVAAFLAKSPTRATQQFRNGKVTRWAVCPSHKKRSSDFIGISATYDRWIFRCKEGHYFNASADPSAPAKIEDITTWEATQKQAEIKELNRGQ